MNVTRSVSFLFGMLHNTRESALAEADWAGTKPRIKNDDVETRPHCHGPLIEIDHYGERLIGCIECNR
jgi:hypothetical protein